MTASTASGTAPTGGNMVQAVGVVGRPLAAVHESASVGRLQPHVLDP